MTIIGTSTDMDAMIETHDTLTPVIGNKMPALSTTATPSVSTIKSNSTSPSVFSEAIIDFESEVRQSNRAQGGTNKRELTI